MIHCLGRMIAMLVCAGALAPGATAGSGGEAGAAAGNLPANRWVTLYDGPGVAFGISNMLWDSDRDVGIVWTADSVGNGAGLCLFSPEKRTWAVREGSLPAGYELGCAGGYAGRSPVSSVYLPGIRKLLVVWTHRSSGQKKTATSWLVDVSSGAWEPVSDRQWADEETDFGMPEVRTVPTPLWGAMAYDALNGEAVHVGGVKTWGRVGRQKEPVKPGDWIYDEAAERKHVRRLTVDDKGVAEARRWYPANCGTWTYSEKTGKWAPIDQPMGQQPPGRMLPGLAYDQAAGKMVLFGGDDEARVLDDTWIYDCKSRTWNQARPKTSPPARAGHAAVYVPGANVVMIAGGYTGGWKQLTDTWVYRMDENQWTRLDLDVPELSPAAIQRTAAHDPKRKAVVLFSPSSTRSLAGGTRKLARKDFVHVLRLDLAAAPVKAAEAVAPETVYHCKNFYNREQRTWLPDEWLAGEGAPEDEKVVRARLAALPANTWTELKPPRRAPARVWGTTAYDAKTHTVLAYGGGHFGYNGHEFSEYSLLTNRWRSAATPTRFSARWLQGLSSHGTSVGKTLGGEHFLMSHVCKSLAVDPVSGAALNKSGDVYSLRHHMVVGTIGLHPGATAGDAYDPAYATTPRGLHAYGWAQSSARGKKALCRANVAAGKWDLVCETGGPDHNQYSHFSYDSKRDRLLYFVARPPAVWAFDFKAGTWAEEKSVGRMPSALLGDSAYVPELDSVLMVFAESSKGPENIYIYDAGERKWSTADYSGDPPAALNTGGYMYGGVFYDAELGLVVRPSFASREGCYQVNVMRLDPKTLERKPL